MSNRESQDSGTAEHGARVPQKTLDGGQAEPVECEYFEGCKNQVKYEFEASVYDGYGYVDEELLACQTCFDEHFELEIRDEFEARKLTPGERWHNAE